MSARNIKIRERLFPDEIRFDPRKGGYASFPLILRRAQFLFSARAWQVYSYIAMRIGPDGIGWLTINELAWDLDFRNTTKLRAYISKLEDDGWLVREESASREYFLAPDPTSVLRGILARGGISPAREEAIDEVLESLRLPLLGSSRPEKAPSSMQTKELDDLLSPYTPGMTKQTQQDLIAELKKLKEQLPVECFDVIPGSTAVLLRLTGNEFPEGRASLLPGRTENLVIRVSEPSRAAAISSVEAIETD